MKIIVLSLFIIQLFIGLTVVIGNDDDDDDDDTELEFEKVQTEMDSFVDSGSSTSNYGESYYLEVNADGFGHCASYIYFDFDDEPDNWKEAEIRLYIYSISQTMTVNIFLASSVWEELTITYDNRPALGGLIETFSAQSTGIIDFDLSDLIEDLLDDDEEGITICLNVSSTSEGDMMIYSEEGTNYKDWTPLLIWTYEPVNDVDVGMIIFIILIILIPIGIVSIGVVVLYYRRRGKTAPRKPVVPPMDVVAPTQPSRVQPSTPPSSLKVCESCGEKIPPYAKEFCPNCGEKILQEAIEFCPSCGNKVSPNAKFCEACGNDID
ncbi:MAG: zinc ribbon domain-containing protein [Promethearchaeota archaeon]|nr:MAG: zinc ribbon domain-containing protein [Candidatus Lokiarchaeota archaeon]